MWGNDPSPRHALYPHKKQLRRHAAVLGAPPQNKSDFLFIISRLQQNQSPPRHMFFYTSPPQFPHAAALGGLYIVVYSPLRRRGCRKLEVKLRLTDDIFLV